MLTGAMCARCLAGDGGTGAMELVALDMKQRGMYISRQLSFASATYQTQVPCSDWTR